MYGSALAAACSDKRSDKRFEIAQSLIQRATVDLQAKYFGDGSSSHGNALH